MYVMYVMELGPRVQLCSGKTILAISGPQNMIVIIVNIINIVCLTTGIEFDTSVFMYVIVIVFIVTTDVVIRMITIVILVLLL